MSHPISRRTLVSTSGAFAASVVAGVPLLATDAELDRVGRKNPAALLGLP